eukprot:scaffold7516_cov376-Prasinococcus_capsulatus_cf.AAC.3
MKQRKNSAHAPGAPARPVAPRAGGHAAGSGARHRGAPRPGALESAPWIRGGRHRREGEEAAHQDLRLPLAGHLPYGPFVRAG